MNKNSWTLCGFLSLCVLIVAYSLKIDYDSFHHSENLSQNLNQENEGSRENEESLFSQIKYFMVKEEGPFLHLSAQELRTDNYFILTAFLYPIGVVFTSRGTPVHFKANSGSYNKRTQSMLLNGDVLINDDSSRVTSDRAHYQYDDGKFELYGGVNSNSVSKNNGDKLVIFANEGVFWPKKKVGQYIGEVKGELKRVRPYEPGLKFSSDRLWADLISSEVTLDGQVVLKRENLEAQSLKALIYLDNYNKKLKYYTLYDDVKIVEKVKNRRGVVSVRKAYGEKLEGYMNERKIVLTGSPKVIQGKDIVKGNRITLVENNELIEVDDSNSRFIMKKKGE